MKKFNPNKNIIITLILVILVVTVISLTAAHRTNSGKTNVAQSAVNDSVSLVDRAIAWPGKMLSNGWSSVTDLLNTYQENQRLKAQLDEYNELAIQKEDLTQENEALKKELTLNQTLSGYEKVTANVITRTPDTWQDILVVDRGSNDGVEPNMTVMSQEGIIGRVIEVNALSSKIELLTSKNQTSNHFPVQIGANEGNAYGLLKNYDEKSQVLVVSEIVGDMEINVGDVVKTSGLGGNSPANLPIGVVQEVKPDSFGLEREVYIQPYSDMYNISVVTIVKRLAGSGATE